MCVAKSVEGLKGKIEAETCDADLWAPIEVKGKGGGRLAGTHRSVTHNLYMGSQVCNCMCCVYRVYKCVAHVLYTCKVAGVGT